MIDKVEEIKECINKKFPKQKKITLIVVVGILGILLIFLSELFDSGTKAKSSGKSISLNTDTYKQEIESELTGILSNISGVGKVKVMVTIEGTTENIYAEEYDTQKDQQDGKNSESCHNKYVVIDNGNEKEALLKKVIKPKINGVIVVCEGGDNLVVSEKIYKAVSTVLAISSTRVCVVKG